MGNGEGNLTLQRQPLLSLSCVLLCHIPRTWRLVWMRLNALALGPVTLRINMMGACTYATAPHASFRGVSGGALGLRTDVQGKSCCCQLLRVSTSKWINNSAIFTP